MFEKIKNKRKEKEALKQAIAMFEDAINRVNPFIARLESGEIGANMTKEVFADVYGKAQNYKAFAIEQVRFLRTYLEEL